LQPSTIPKAQDYVKGVINLRGKVLPIVDLRLKLGLVSIPNTPNTCIIVIETRIQSEPVLVGVIVDAVDAVLEIDNSQLLPLPSLDQKYRNTFISGVVHHVASSFLMVLDVDAIFSTEELMLLQNQSESNKITEAEKI
jgi:purine-binding chemotaxis protein CheW